MKKLNLTLMLLSFTVFTSFAQTPTQQWISTINSGTSSVDGYDVCNFPDYFYYSKKIVLNNSSSKVGITGISGCDMLTTVLDANNGNLLLNNNYTASTNDAGQVIISDAGGNFISGGILNFNTSSHTGLISKISSSNTVLFQNIVTSNTNRAQIGCLQSDNNGNIYGYSSGYLTNGTSVRHDLYKFNSNGILQWTNTISDYDWFYGYPGRMVLDPSGNAIFTGKRQTSSSPSTYDIVVRKVDPNGNQLWQVYYNIGEDYIRDLTTDASGNIYFSMFVGGVEDRVVKLNGINGNVVWSTAFSLGTGGKIKINANGNVLVGGTQTRALDANSGALLWTSNNPSYAFDTDNNSKIYSVLNNKIYTINGNGTSPDSITVTIPTFTVSLRDIVVSGNAFYVTGKRVSGSNSKIFVAKYSFCNNQNATITANGATSFCVGGNVTLSSNSGSNYSWSNGATTQSIIVNQSGNYSVSVTDANGCIATATQVVSVNQLPVVNISILPTFLNINSSPINIIGSPNGGAALGVGVVNNQFNPAIAGLGTASVTYTYTDNNGCSNSSTATTIVYDTTGIICTTYDTITTSITVTDTLLINAVISGVNPPNNVNTLQIYPNPARTHITIDNGNFALMNGYTVRINNTLGQTVFSQAVNQQQFFIDLSSWSGSGMYYLDLIDNQGNTIESKVIVIQ